VRSAYFFFIFSLFGGLALLMNSALAESASTGKSVNIGDLEINGAVRKPLIGYIDSDRALHESTGQVSKSKLQEFEKRLTQFKTVSEWKGEHPHDNSSN
jgi:hypothetical protein